MIIQFTAKVDVHAPLPVTGPSQLVMLSPEKDEGISMATVRFSDPKRFNTLANGDIAEVTINVVRNKT